MARIERFASRTHAELARTVLVTAGIPAFVSGDDAGGLHPEIPYGIGGTAVVVPDHRYEEAIAVLDAELGEGPVDDAALEAAALAATPADPSAVGPGLPAPVTDASDTPDVSVTPAPPAADRSADAATTRTGRRRPAFLLAVVLMVIALLVIGGFTLLQLVWDL
jgi:hypothetical protein